MRVPLSVELVQAYVTFTVNSDCLQDDRVGTAPITPCIVIDVSFNTKQTLSTYHIYSAIVPLLHIYLNTKFVF